MVFRGSCRRLADDKLSVLFVPANSTVRRIRLMLTKTQIVGAVLMLLLLFCVTGAMWTAYWSLRFGLAPRPPLSEFQIVLRLLAVGVASFLWWRRRDLIERIALSCAIIAAGSSALFGFGVDSTTLQVVRLLFHFLAYSIGACAILRWFAAIARHRRRATQFGTS